MERDRAAFCRVAWKLFLAGAFFSISIGLTGCNPFKAKPAAEKGVQEFHDRLNRGHFSGIYQNAHAEFRKASPEKDFLPFLEAIHRKLGTVQSSKEANWGINSQNMTTTVTLVYETKFSGGDATETFNFRIEGNEAILLGYNISSMALITK